MNPLHTTRRLVLLASVASVAALAQDDTVDDVDDDTPQPSGPLVDLVRTSTESYQEVQNAIDAGYEAGPCVSSPLAGAMGIHYVNLSLIGDGTLDPANPEALIYEPQPDGSLQLLGAEYITLAEFWPDPERPVLAGHLPNYVGEPNRYGLPAFFQIHVWAWRANPIGTFADFNPEVSCEAQPLEDAPPPAEASAAP
ncbi:MAG: hypothetical protein JXB36_16675 [Gammaproteobacteria bacterium]|nr:hypothetical protein [Gammaproteobacteria bacterium]